LREHLEKYPFLKNHPDFVEFLDQYAGARLDQHESADANWCYATIFGIGDWEMREMAPPVDIEGFYEFALVTTGSSKRPASDDLQAVFAFDGTGSRANSVYAKVHPVDQPEQASFAIFCPDFGEWLARFVRAGGRLLPPRHG
jgi:hypothetical protein